MPEEAQSATWESVTAPPAATVDPPATTEDVPVTPTPPAETPTLEKPATPPLEAGAQPAAREDVSEPVKPEPAKEEPKPTEEYVAEADDPPEIAALTTPAAKKWAKRQFKDAEIAHRYDSYEVPISTFVDDLNKRSPSRFVEMVNDLITGFPDHVSQKLFGMSAEDVKSRLQGAQPTPTTEQPMPAELPSTDNEVRLSDENKTLKTELQTLKDELGALKGEFTNQKQAGRQAEIAAKQDELYNGVWGVVDEGIRNLGLDPQPNDPPKIASLKKAASRLLDRFHVEAAFDANPENQKLVKYVYEATNCGEYDNAFRELDNLKVRARAAFSTVTGSDEFRAIMDQIEEYANQSKTSTREANPVPPVPGSTAGITIKPPTTWDEAIAQSAS